MAGENNDFEIITIVTPGINNEMKKDEFIKWFKSQNYPNIRVLLDESGQSFTDYQIRALIGRAHV